MKKFISLFLTIFMIMGFSIQSFAKKEDNTAYHIFVDINSNGEKNTFSSIEDAKAYVRTLPKDKGDIVVEIADGCYELSAPLVFDEKDSGNENCTIHYVAKQGAKPVISGGKRVNGEWTDEGNGVYSVAFSRNKKLRSLYVNGKRRYMTADVVKAKGADGEYELKQGSSDSIWVDGVRSKSVVLPKYAIPQDTRNPEDIELMTQTRWNTTIVCVDKIRRQGPNIVADLQMPYGAIAQTLGWGNEYQFEKNNLVSNVFEHLDEPGEFYFDKSEGRLYYIPTQDEDLNSAEVVVPEIETLVEICGSNKTSRVSDISFEGLSFAYSDWNLVEVDGSHGRATNQGAATLFAYAEWEWHDFIYRAYDVNPGAIMCRSCNNISFEKNTVAHTGNEGISLVNDCSDISLIANTIIDTAGSALLIGHPQHEYIGDKNSGNGNHSEKEKYDADTEAVCKNILVSNNLFKDTSRLFWGCAGIMVYICEELNFIHNQVENTTYSGISLGWGWWNMNGDEESVLPGIPSTTMKNNTIMYNKFVNTITTLSDAGAIYTIGNMPGTIISENYINGIGSPYSNNAYHIRGIHIDEGTKHVYGEKNVIDISPDCACIDCGDWGKKGDNKWCDNYSNAQSYTTTDSYEPGTVIENSHYVPDKNWDKTALSVIKNSGIEDKYASSVLPEEADEEIEIIKAIPDYKPSIPLIVGMAVGALCVFVATAFFAYKKGKKDSLLKIAEKKKTDGK